MIHSFGDFWSAVLYFRFPLQNLSDRKQESPVGMQAVLVLPKSASGQFVQSNQASKIMGARHSAQLKIHFQAAIEVGKIMERDCISQTVLYLFNYALNLPP